MLGDNSGNYEIVVDLSNQLLHRVYNRLSIIRRYKFNQSEDTTTNGLRNLRSRFN